MLNATDMNTNNFSQILKCLSSSENENRTIAEDAFDAIPTETRVIHLLNSITDENLVESEKLLACVLLRGLITNDFREFHPKLGTDDQTRLKECLLPLIQTETNSALKKRMCDIVTELAKNLVDEDGQNNWPEFLQFSFKCASSTSPRLKECFLLMFANVPSIFGNQQNNYLDLTKRMLQQSLTDESNIKIRAQAVRAVCSFIIAHKEEIKIQKHFRGLMSIMIQVVRESMEQITDDYSILTSFIDLCESSSKFLGPNNIRDIIRLCSEVFLSEQIDDKNRHLALEVIVTLCEVESSIITKKSQSYIRLLIQHILKVMMVDLEEDEMWSFADEIEDEDNDSNAIIAGSSLHRIACGLGGKLVLPHIWNNVIIMLSNNDWRFRHGALMAISAAGEGCHEQMEPLLSEIIDEVLICLQDQHPRVRYAACHVIEQMSSDFAQILQKKFHEEIIFALLTDDNLNPRVQAHAGAALASFIHDCPKPILTRYSEVIMMTLLEAILNVKTNELLKKGTKAVLEQVFRIIALVADTAEEQFVTLYDRLMPHLKYIIKNIPSELGQLRGQTLESISLIGLAVDREKFAQDAKQVMNILLENYNGGRQEEIEDQTDQQFLIEVVCSISECGRFARDVELLVDILLKNAEACGENCNAGSLHTFLLDSISLAILRGQYTRDIKQVMNIILKSYEERGEKVEEDSFDSYSISALARICMVLGRDFQPYLQLALGPVMKTAAIRPKITLFDDDDLDDTDRANWYLTPLGGQQHYFGIQPSGLILKFGACILLNMYVSELEDGFADYAEEVTRLMIPLLKCVFHDGIRRVTAQTLPLLLECVRIKGPGYVRKLWTLIGPELLSAIRIYIESVVIGDLFQSFAMCIDVLGEVTRTNPIWMSELLLLFERNLLQHFSKKEAVSKKQKDDNESIAGGNNDDDDDDDNKKADTIKKIDKMTHLIRVLLKIKGTSFDSHFEHLLPYFVTSLDKRRKWSDHQWGIRVFNSLIEFTGPHCRKYKNYFLPSLRCHVNDGQPEVRQAACCGFGLLALYGGEEFERTCVSVIPILLRIITDPEAHNEDNVLATENAISAIAKIFKYNSSHIYIKDVLPHWLHSLPVLRDTNEVPHVCNYLCELVERNHPLVLGVNNSNLPNVIQIMTEVFVKEAIRIEHLVARRMIAIIRDLKRYPDVLESCVKRLAPANRIKLTEILTTRRRINSRY